MTRTLEGISDPAMGLTRARGGQGGMLLATRRAERIEADADTPPRSEINAVAAKSTSPGGSELSSFIITACEPPEIHSNRAGHGVW